ATQPNFWHMFFNNSRPVFQDARVRQALTYALDRQALIDRTMLGKADPAAGPIPPALSEWRNSALKPYPYDTATAMQLREGAGYTTGADGTLQKGGQPLEFSILVSPIFAEWEEIALFAQQSWSKLGIKVTIDKQETNVAVSRLYDGDYDMFMGFRDMV